MQKSRDLVTSNLIIGPLVQNIQWKLHRLLQVPQDFMSSGNPSSIAKYFCKTQVLLFHRLCVIKRKQRVIVHPYSMLLAPPAREPLKWLGDVNEHANTAVDRRPRSVCRIFQPSLPK